MAASEKDDAALAAVPSDDALAAVPSDDALAFLPSDAPTIYWPGRDSALAIEIPIDDIPLSPPSSYSLPPEYVQVEAPGSKRKRHIKSARGKSYSPREDENICKSWLVISQDPTTGTNRHIDRFYERVANHFNKHNKSTFARSFCSIKSRWLMIRRSCAKFASFLAAVERDNPGASEADKVTMAKELWSKDDGGKPFAFVKCWRILKHSPKWKIDNDIVPAGGAALGGCGGTSGDGACTKALLAITSEDGGGTSDRPGGHKKGKLLRDDSSPSVATTSSTDSEGSSQEMSEDKEEKRKVREIKKAAFEAQRCFYENQKAEAIRRREEVDSRREEENRRREEADRRRDEADRRMAEIDILAIKVDGLDEESKTYIMEQKRDIIARHRFDKIIKKEIPSKVVYEDDKVLAVRDISPQAPTHIIIIPKIRDGLTALSTAEERHSEILDYVLYVAKHVAEQERLEEGFRIVINDGPTGCQSVHHLHVHLLGAGR